MSGFSHIEVKEFIGKYGASYRCYTGHFIDQSLFINSLGYEAMGYTMKATGTVSEGGTG
jgi:hypothetical protein